MKKKVVFLYLFGLHQLYHTAMTAMELGQFDDKYEVQCLSCNKEHTRVLEEIKKNYPLSNTQIISLPPPFRYKYLNFKKKTYPSVNAMVKGAKKIINTADLVVTTSHGTPRMLKKFGITKPKIIYQYHGCGDRKYGFDPNFKRFDYMLLPGLYHQNRLLDEKIIKKEKTKIVGWPKLDFPIDIMKTKQDLFKNNKPIILYTPHWEPKLSSYKWAELILEYFKKNEKYNFIFAPHLLIKHWRVRFGYNINFNHYASDNIIIDFQSDYSTNGTYLAVSDLYMGDVSSMIYEFIAFRRRPALFLNAHNIDWKNDVNYRFWNYGDVVDSIDELDEKITNVFKTDKYTIFQEKEIVKYMDLSDEKSSFRAAKALDVFCSMT